MKKSDLKNGMAVETIYGEFGIVLENVSYNGNENGTIIKFKNYFNDVDGWNEDLKCKYDLKKDICKVYNFKSWGCDFNYIEKFIDRDQLLWERKQEIDWTKVPKGTMIKVKEWEGGAEEERKFITYLGEEIDEHNGRFIVSWGDDDWTSRNYATIDNPKQEWLK